MTEIQALLLIKSILESADIHGIEHMISEDCEYLSTGRGIIGRNSNQTVEFLSSMTGDNYVYMIFVDVNDEGLVDRIVSSQENYSIEYDDLRFGADESEYAFISAPTTVKDWITALSMWLETANVDIDDFYQYIDEDTRVVFQKGDAESITLESGLDVEDYFDQLMNQHFDAVPHIIRDEEDGLILTYGPMSAIATLNEEGTLVLISIYIDTRDEDEATDEVGYIEEDLTKETIIEEDLY